VRGTFFRLGAAFQRETKNEKRETVPPRVTFPGAAFQRETKNEKRETVSPRVTDDVPRCSVLLFNVKRKTKNAKRFPHG